MQRFKNKSIIVWGFIEMFLFSGVIFGWDQFEIVYKDGLDFFPCNKTSNETNQKPPDCDQNLNFLICFTFASLSKGISGLFIAKILETWGLRVSRILASLFLVAGGIILYVANKEASWWLLPGIICLGLGGAQIRLNNYTFSDLYPKYASTIVALYSGAFCASAAVPLLFTIGVDLGMPRLSQELILGWSLVSLLMMVPTFCLLPKHKIRAADEEHTPLLDPTDEQPNGHQHSNGSPPNGSINHEQQNGHINGSLPNSSIDRASEEPLINGTVANPRNNYGATGDSTQPPLPKPGVSRPLGWADCKDSICSISFMLHLYYGTMMALAVMMFNGQFHTWTDRVMQAYPNLGGGLHRIYGYSQLLMLVLGPITGLMMDKAKAWANNAQDSDARARAKLRAGAPALMFCWLIIMLMILCQFFDQPGWICAGLALFILARPAVNAVNPGYLKIRFPNEHFNYMVALQGTVITILSLVQMVFYFLMDHHYLNLALGILIGMVSLSLINPLHLFCLGPNNNR